MIPFATVTSPVAAKEGTLQSSILSFILKSWNKSFFVKRVYLITGSMDVHVWVQIVLILWYNCKGILARCNNCPLSVKFL